MKKYKLWSLLVVVLGLSFVSPVQASNLNNLATLNVLVSSQINKDCGLSPSAAPIWSCYVQKMEAGWPKAQGYIYIREGMPKDLLPYAFLHSFGGFLTYNVSEEDMIETFNPDPSLVPAVRNAAANAFVMWFYGGYVPPKAGQLFLDSLTQW